MLKQTLSTIVCACMLTLSASGQRADSKKSIVAKNAPQGTITFTTQKLPGFGPSGNMSTGVSSYDPYDTEGQYKAYPKMKNKPAWLHNAESYFFIMDEYQFFFQNYSQGIFSKAFFLEKAAQYKWPLADTVKLSRKPLEVGIAAIAGYNESNELMYIIDANNNGDFGDDVLKILSVNPYITDTELALPVHTEYFSGNQIKSEPLLVFPYADKRRSTEDKISLMFSFPQFRYARFDYKGEPYFIVTETHPYAKAITVMPDVPNFSSNVRKSGIQPGQFVRIGDADFQFAGLAENGNKITLTGKDVSAFSPKKPISNKVTTNGPTAALAGAFSSQLGFKAPVIKGNNINPLAKHITSMLSTADLKGKYVFVDFWSSYCIPCIAEFPNLKAAYDKFDRSKFEIVGVLDERDQSVTKRLIGEGNLTWPTIVTNAKDTETKGYNISSYPTTYLLDPDGKIIAIDLRGDDLMNKLNTLIKL